MLLKRKMNKRLFFIPLALGLAIGVASCNGGEPTEPTIQEPVGSYTVKVYDIDNELVGDKTIQIKDCPTLLEGLNKNFNVVSSQGSYGTMINQINNSVVDKNYYLSILENGEYAQVGIDSLEVDDGDVFEFKSECMNTIAWGGTFDDYDILVDKIVYHYAKTTLKESVKKATTYLSTIYWEEAATNLMLKNGYSSSLFDVSGLYTEAFKNTVTSADLTNLPAATEVATDANYAKWYYAARAIGQNTDAFATIYSSYLEALTEYPSFGEYALPFSLSIAKDLKLESKVKSEVINTEYRGTMAVEGLSWQLAGLAMYKELNSTELAPLTMAAVDAEVEAWGAKKDVILSSILLPYAAMNLNARTYKITENADVLAYLLDNYFDKTTYQFSAEVAGDTSSNQIYAALMAYKVSRDTKKAAYLFA